MKPCPEETQRRDVHQFSQRGDLFARLVSDPLGNFVHGKMAQWSNVLRNQSY